MKGDSLSRTKYACKGKNAEGLYFSPFEREREKQIDRDPITFAAPASADRDWPILWGNPRKVGIDKKGEPNLRFELRVTHSYPILNFLFFFFLACFTWIRQKLFGEYYFYRASAFFFFWYNSYSHDYICFFFFKYQFLLKWKKKKKMHLLFYNRKPLCGLHLPI